MADKLDVYQFKKIEETLEVVKNDQKAHSRILSDISSVLKGIESTMKSFSKISEKQIKQELMINSLVEDGKEFKEFIKNSLCAQHESEIKNLNKSDDSKNKNVATAIIGVMSAMVTGLLTWIITGK